MAEPAPFRVRNGEDVPVDSILDVLGAGYGRSFDRTWFDWKHRSSPWGPSRIVVAEDDEGLLGVVFAMDWSYRRGAETTASGRLVDGSTTPRSARRGVFQRIIAAHLAHWDGVERTGLVVATATPQAKSVHVGKNHAVPLAPIRSFVRPTARSIARIDSDLDVLATFPTVDTPDRWTTGWDERSLRWRIDARSGLDYEVCRLRSADGPTGVIHRTVTTRGLRTLVVAARWGSPGEVRTLVRAVAHRRRAAAVLVHAGPGTSQRRPRTGIARGDSLVCVWNRMPHDPTTGTTTSDWRFDGLDLEGVI